MPTIMREPKFPKFMGLIYSKGMNIKDFVKLLHEKGYEEYNYNLVRRKLRGDSPLEYEDIIIFSKVMGVEESIFFNFKYTKCIPEEKIS